MRRFLLSLLILLTVFRGAMGDAMAMEMGAGSGKAFAIENIAYQAINTPATGSFYSNDQATAASQLPPCHQNAATAVDESAKPSHAQCVACQVCHSSACAFTVLAVVVEPLAQEPPHSELRTWHSADLGTSFKPPVS
jgi:hypothetical protein